MKILVASDIFGDTPELRSAAKVLSKTFIIISPYPDKLPFSTVEQAYATFLTCGGIDTYVQKVGFDLAKSVLNSLEKSPRRE